MLTRELRNELIGILTDIFSGIRIELKYGLRIELKIDLKIKPKLKYEEIFDKKTQYS